MYDFNAYVDRKNSSCIKWDFQKADYGMDGLIPFSIADADHRTYQPIIDRLKERVDRGIIGYTDIDDEYYKAVKGWCERRHSWNVEKEWIVPTGGIVPAICNAIEALLMDDDGVIVQPPVYDPFYSVIKASGRKIIKNPLILDETGYRMDLEGLRDLCRKGARMIILCSPHNPVCRVWTKDELQALADICREYDLYVISDEIHWDIVLDGHIHTCMGLFNEIHEKLIVCTSCSKTFNVAGLETSNLIIPGKETRETFQNYLYSRYLFCPNTLGMEAVKAAYKDGDKWVDELLVHIQKNAEILMEFFREKMPKVKVAKPEGTFLMWLDMRAYGFTSDELIEKIARSGAGLNNGSHYGEDYDGFVRMNIACPEDQLKAGLECIYKALEE